MSSETTQMLTPKMLLGVRSSRPEMTSSVSPGQQEADEQAGLGEDDEAHDEQRPGAGPFDDRGGVEPGDEGDVMHDEIPSVGAVGGQSSARRCASAVSRAEGGT